MQTKNSQLGSDGDEMNVFTSSIVDDDEESCTSPIVRSDIHFRGLHSEEDAEHSGMPTPQLSQKGNVLLRWHYFVLVISPAVIPQKS